MRRPGAGLDGHGRAHAGRRARSFLKKYADLRTVLTDAARAYTDDVREGRYPAAEHGYR